MDTRFADHTLEGTLTEDITEPLRKACTAGWDQAFAATEEGHRASDEVVFRRHDRTVRGVIPWMDRHIDLASSDLIDFGAGCGSSALAFSKFVRQVRSFEIDDISAAAFKTRMDMFGVDNVEFTQCPPETIFEQAAAVIGPSTSVMLVAVVEHLLEAEQVSYLRAFWDKLAPGQVLAITETPNYLAYFDSHTFQRPFAHYVPDGLFPAWLERQGSSLRFREPLLAETSTEATLNQRRRYGLGVTSEPFEQALGMDLNEIVVGDGFDTEMLNLFPLEFDDKVLLSAFKHYDVRLPVGFAKNVLSFAFKKPRSVEEAAQVKAWNEARRHEVIEQYGAKV